MLYDARRWDEPPERKQVRSADILIVWTIVPLVGIATLVVLAVSAYATEQYAFANWCIDAIWLLALLPLCAAARMLMCSHDLR